MQDRCHRCDELVIEHATMPIGRGIFLGGDGRRRDEPEGAGTRYVFTCSSRHTWWLDVGLDGHTEVGRFAVVDPPEPGWTSWSVVPIEPWTWEAAWRAQAGVQDRFDPLVLNA